MDGFAPSCNVHQRGRDAAYFARKFKHYRITSVIEKALGDKPHQADDHSLGSRSREDESEMSTIVDVGFAGSVDGSFTPSRAYAIVPPRARANSAVADDHFPFPHRNGYDQEAMATPPPLPSDYYRQEVPLVSTVSPYMDRLKAERELTSLVNAHPEAFDEINQTAMEELRRLYRLADTITVSAPPADAIRMLISDLLHVEERKEFEAAVVVDVLKGHYMHECSTEPPARLLSQVSRNEGDAPDTRQWKNQALAELSCLHSEAML